MLAEALLYLVTACDKHSRRIGYLHEAIALQARARRCRTAWAPHMNACRTTISNAAEQCRQHRHVVVLGSGPLTDVPIALLIKRFEHVHLVDIAQPRAVARRYRAVPHVSTHTIDLTRTVAILAAMGPRDELPMPTHQLPALARHSEVDLIVSVNLLSQLAVLPIRHACDRLAIDDAAALAWARAFVRAHLHALVSQDAPVCLISDVRARYVDHTGSVTVSDDLLYGQTLPAPDSTWTWPVAPSGELPGGRRAEHEVQAWVHLPKREVEERLRAPSAEAQTFSTLTNADQALDRTSHARRHGNDAL